MLFQDQDMLELWAAVTAVRSYYLMQGNTNRGYEMMWKGESRIVEGPAENPVAACLGWIMEDIQKGTNIHSLAETCIYFRDILTNDSNWVVNVSVSQRNIIAEEMTSEDWEIAVKEVA